MPHCRFVDPTRISSTASTTDLDAQRSCQQDEHISKNNAPQVSTILKYHRPDFRYIARKRRASKYLLKWHKTASIPHLVVHQGRQRQVVEHVSEHLPHRRIAVLPDTLVVKTVPVAFTVNHFQALCGRKMRSSSGCSWTRGQAGSEAMSAHVLLFVIPTSQLSPATLI